MIIASQAIRRIASIPSSCPPRVDPAPAPGLQVGQGDADPQGGLGCGRGRPTGGGGGAPADLHQGVVAALVGVAQIGAPRDGLRREKRPQHRLQDLFALRVQS